MERWLLRFSGRSLMKPHKTHLPHYIDYLCYTACGKGICGPESDNFLPWMEVSFSRKPTCKSCLKYWNTFEYKHMRNNLA